MNKKLKTISIFGKVINLETEYLHLHFFDKVANSEISKILQLKSLKHLNASSSDLLDEHLQIIGQSKSLEILDVDSTEITDEGIAFLASLKNLQQLRLKDNTQLTDKCVPYLTQLKSLAFIHIENTSITLEGFKKLLQLKNLKEIIVDNDFEDYIEELLLISKNYPTKEILLKGVGVIINGKMEL